MKAVNQNQTTVLHTMAALILLFLSSCGGDSDDSPSPTTNNANTQVRIISILVSASQNSLTSGDSLSCLATASYSDNSSGDITTSSVWSSSDVAIATVDANGVVRALGVGRVFITATKDGITSNSLEVNITENTTAPQIISISATAPAPSLHTGQSMLLSAIATYTDTSTADITAAATWSSADTSVATVSQTGLLAGISAGTTTITASKDNITSNSLSITVTAAPPVPAVLKSITISSATTSLSAGQVAQISATGTYADGSVNDISASVTWSASAATIASMGADGKLTALGAGSTTVAAAMDGITSNSLTITVSETWVLAGYAVGKTLGNESNGAAMSEVILLPDGSYKMYYGTTLSGGLTGIKYAESSDGAAWTVKGTALQGAGSTTDPEYLVSGPSVLKLSNGQYRMYYQSAPQMAPGQTPQYHVRSAISNDAVTFTRENGVRINITAYDAASPLRLAGHGTYFYAADGQTVVAIFSGELATDSPGPSSLIMATSSDGLTFGNVQKLYSSWHDPIVVKSNNVFRMYATYMLEKQGTAASLDGLAWPAGMTDLHFQNSQGSILTEGNAGIGDIGGVVLANGQIRLYTNYGSQLASDDIVYFNR